MPGCINQFPAVYVVQQKSTRQINHMATDCQCRYRTLRALGESKVK